LRHTGAPPSIPGGRTLSSIADAAPGPAEWATLLLFGSLLAALLGTLCRGARAAWLGALLGGLANAGIVYGLAGSLPWAGLACLLGSVVGALRPGAVGQRAGSAPLGWGWGRIGEGFGVGGASGRW
jgi:hypothetical protein